MDKHKTLVVATMNEHKIAEISAIAGSFGYRAVGRGEAGVPDIEVEETGTTFEENSLIKARAIFDMLGGAAAVAADDSGIEVDALSGEPGVYSAHYAEVDAEADAGFFAAAEAEGLEGRRRQDRANNIKLLCRLEGVPLEKRTARFVSVITCLRPGKEPIVCRGTVEGHVDFAETGDGGFGYDPLFIPLGYDCSFGLFGQGDKNAISHRGRALAMLAEKLEVDR